MIYPLPAYWRMFTTWGLSSKAIRQEIVRASHRDRMSQLLTAYLSASLISCSSVAGASQQHLDLGVLICIAMFYNTHISRNGLMMTDEAREILRNFVSLQFGIIPQTKFYSS